MRLEDIDPGGDCSGTTYVDQAQIKVYYTIPAGPYNTGVISPTANAIGTGDGWNNAGNAYTDGGSPPATDNQSDKHQYYNFGFNIPSSAMIDGIEVSADAWSAAPLSNIWSDNFGTSGSNSNDIPNWEEQGDDGDSSTRAQ